MKPASFDKHSFLSLFFLTMIWMTFSGHLSAQSTIGWQKIIGTTHDDTPMKILTDQSGNLIVIGKEPHEDFTGQLRPYLMVTKLAPNGDELVKNYHDVAFNLFSPPIDYSIGQHFLTEEFGEQLINLVITINNQTYLYKILESTGEFYTYEIVQTPVIDLDPQNEKVYAYTLCSKEISCYGPDSLIVERFDPTPDSLIFNPIEWTFELKQNIRTAPIQGHYDFDVEEIRLDAEGNTYLLVQIERWDFQFCTDCANAFIDAWCEIFKFDSTGQLVRHVNLKTTKAVVSNMRFVHSDDQSMVVQINDINAAGTKVISSIHIIDHDLDLIRKFDLDDAYTVAYAETEDLLYAFGQKADAANPEIHGLTDIVFSTYTMDGELNGRYYFGGSGFEFFYGVAFTPDGAPVFLARSDSDDFDLQDHIGNTDMWVVSLGDEGTSAIGDQPVIFPLHVYPNPCQEWLYLGANGLTDISIFDAMGRLVAYQEDMAIQSRIDVQHLSAGVYSIRAMNADQKQLAARFVRQ